MTKPNEIDNTTRVSFTPAQLFGTIAIILAAGGWCWRQDARAETHEKTAVQFQAALKQVQDDLQSVKSELVYLRKGGYTLTPTQTPVTETR